MGAGFNRDAAAEAELCNNRYGYPLVKELAKLCFGLADVPSDSSIEQLFDNEIDKNNWSALEHLSHTLMGADYYVASSLAQSDTNAYKTLLKKFPDSSFLSFNYDSLLEILLFNLKRWLPNDGFGVTVKANLPQPRCGNYYLPKQSQNKVLHLHGSLCIYTNDAQSEFIFDPDTISNCFRPYERIPPVIGAYRPIAQRVIAPIPNKAAGLKDAFIKQVYDRASQMVRDTQIIIAIGYSFNVHDRDSYKDILHAARGRSQIVLVCPDATELKTRLKSEEPEIEWLGIPQTFADWINNGCHGAP